MNDRRFQRYEQFNYDEYDTRNTAVYEDSGINARMIARDFGIKDWSRVARIVHSANNDQIIIKYEYSQRWVYFSKKSLRLKITKCLNNKTVHTSF